MMETTISPEVQAMLDACPVPDIAIGEDLKHGDLEIDARVARGVALLDVMHPQWDEDIDLCTFDMANCQKCALGQLYDWYHDGCVSMGDPNDKVIAQFGFCSRIAMHSPCHLTRNWEYGERWGHARAMEYRQLTEAWSQVIKDRRLKRTLALAMP